MIKLIHFAACEKVIIGKDNISSLIGMLEHVIVNGEAAKSLTENTGLPFNWSAICLFNRTEEVAETATINLKMEVIAPNGKTLMGGNLDFVVTNDSWNFRNQIAFPVFPIGQAGVYRVTLAIKNHDAEEWEQVGEYPVLVIHDLTEVNNENQNESANESV